MSASITVLLNVTGFEKESVHFIRDAVENFWDFISTDDGMGEKGSLQFKGSGDLREGQEHFFEKDLRQTISTANGSGLDLRISMTFIRDHEKSDFENIQFLLEELLQATSAAARNPDSKVQERQQQLRDSFLQAVRVLV